MIIDGAQPADAPDPQLSRFGFIRKRFQLAWFQGRAMGWSGRLQMRLKPFCEVARIVSFQPAESFCGIRVRQDFSDAWQRFVNLSVCRDGTGNQVDWRLAVQRHGGNEPVGQAQDEKPLPSGPLSLILIVSLALSPKAWHIADGSTTRNLPCFLVHRLRTFVHAVCATAW